MKECGEKLSVEHCLDWHFKGHLTSAKTENHGKRIRARCPACGGSRTLTISAGQNQWVVWNCFRCGDDAAIRKALYAARVPNACLPRTGTEETPAGLMAAILFDSHSLGAAKVRLLFIAAGHTEWPRGRALEEAARVLGVDRATAYRARKAGALVPPGTASTNHILPELVKDLLSCQAIRDLASVARMRQISAMRQPEISAMRQEQPGEDGRRLDADTGEWRSRAEATDDVWQTRTEDQWR